MVLPDDHEYNAAYAQFAALLKDTVALNDPASHYVWQYLNDGYRGSAVVGFDMNIYPLYVLNCTGKGVRTLILDDAIDRLHWDLKDNYDASISVNLNEPQFKSDPRGKYEEMREEDNHGTRCAGLVAAVANNGLCSHGVAYHSKVGAVRMLAGPVTDILEANALSHQQKTVDIYCASWGPSDDGQTMDLPRSHASAALIKGAEQGRRGLGSIVIFASGNGGSIDHCGADGFVSSPYIIAVAALTDAADQPLYGEACSATRVSVPVAGSFGLNGGTILPSTSENNQCVMHFTGTSAAAPLAAGCFALVLEARPNITTRDLENILPWIARLPTPADKGWQVNGAGVLHSSRAGFGLLDCTRMVQLAQRWNPVGPLCKKKVQRGVAQPPPWAKYQDAIYNDEHFFKLTAENVENFQEKLEKLQTSSNSSPMHKSEKLSIVFTVDNDPNQGCILDIVEKVVVSFQWMHMCRGMTSITLTSPSNTQASILVHRPLDQFAGAVNMSINSVKFWGESIYGKWTIEIVSDGECVNAFVNNYEGRLGVLVLLELEFWGSLRSDSGFERNKANIEPYLSDVSKAALRTGQAHILSEKEVKETFNFQRWMALKSTKRFVETYRPDLFN